MKDVHTNGGTNHQDLCQTLIMTFKWLKQICQNVHGPRPTHYSILLIVQCSCGKCIKKPLPSFQNLQLKSQKIIIHSFIYKWLNYVTLFYICPDFVIYSPKFPLDDNTKTPVLCNIFQIGFGIQP
jgi:hypothetical protein